MKCAGLQRGGTSMVNREGAPGPGEVSQYLGRLLGAG